jgi:diacylglycerol kinase family enzyme
MRLGLIFNEDAGDARAFGDVRRAIDRHGHVVAFRASLAEDWSSHLEDRRLDGVVAAGGDGTVAAVARGLAERAVPLLVLPMGTANNIALSLGIGLDAEACVARWDSGTVVPLDLAVSTGPWGERLVVESVGGGLVTHGIVVMDRSHDVDASREDALDRALASYEHLVRELQPVSWSISVDGEDIAGDYLLVEVLNMGRIGPNFAPTFEADWSDGHLSVVTARLSDRDQILAYVRARRQGADAAPLHLPTRLASSVTITRGDRLHVDDEVFGTPEPPGISVRVLPGAVRVLV